MLKPKRKITRKEIKHDPVLEKIGEANDFMRTHGKLLSYIVIALAAIIVVSILLVNSKKKANLEASGVLGIAEMALNNNDLDNAILQLEDLIQKYTGTRSASIATRLLAQAYLEKQDYEKAESNFRLYIDKYGDDKLILASAYAGLAACDEHNAKFLEAAQDYKKAGQIAPYKFQKHDYFLKSARNFILIEQFNDARQLVENVLADDPDFNTKSAADILAAQIEVLNS
jgi:tetratricopeptide (TPR) repeat protein